jgi:hypothetical protein
VKLFQKVKMAGLYWNVFLVNPNDDSDRMLVSSAFDKEIEAENCAKELNRIASDGSEAVTDSIQIAKLNPIRSIRLVD